VVFHDISSLMNTNASTAANIGIVPWMTVATAVEAWSSPMLWDRFGMNIIRDAIAGKSTQSLAALVERKSASVALHRELKHRRPSRTKGKKAPRGVV